MPVKSKKYVIALAGPTAVGKTACAVALAQALETVIISADSRQIYQEMCIGTAKPDPEQLEAVQHLLIGTKRITEPYSAGIFAREALGILQKQFETHDYVIVTGGTGLYYKALLDGFDPMPKVDPVIRTHWESIFGDRGLTALQQALAKADPAYYAEVDHNNPQRLIRALAMIDATGLPFSTFRKQQKSERSFESIRILLNRPREELYDRINARVDQMMEDGLLYEVKGLLPYRNLQALQTVGYKELFGYLDGNYSIDQAVDKIKQHTRNYAKRQITWFRNQGTWHEFHPGEMEAIISYVKDHVDR